MNPRSVLGTRWLYGAVIGLIVVGACSEDRKHFDEVDAQVLSDATLDAGELEDPEEDTDADLRDVSDADEVDQGDAEPEDAGDAEVDAGLDLFPLDRVIDVDITMSETDWDRIRYEGRSLNSVFTNCDDPEFDDYTKVHAEVSIDGRTFADVGVRKKGYLGSISTVRPSLRIDLDEYDDALSLDGYTAFTLNNSKQDRSYTHQCMAYAAFASAGIAAPRCAFARVSVNGASLGTYVNVEPIKKPFLETHFGDKSGNLYEGSGPADFRADMLNHFEQKTNESAGPGPELQGLADALLKSGDALLTDVESRIDVDEFLRFWATETLVAHWDGYSGDLNNFYVYQNPTSGLLSFIPWGTDGAYEEHAFIPAPYVPKSVYAWSRLPNKLYNTPATRVRYQDTLRALLADHWDEAALNAEIDRIGSLVPDVDAAAIAAQRAFIDDRRAEILAELDATTQAEWVVPERAPAMCTPEASYPLTGSFTTTWGLLDRTFVAAPGNVAAFELAPETTGGAPVDYTYLAAAASAGPGVDVRAPGPSVRVTMYNAPPGKTLFVQFALPGDPIELNVPHALHGFESFGAVVDVSDPLAPAIVGYVGDGHVTFTSFGTNENDLVVGTFDAHIVYL